MQLALNTTRWSHAAGGRQTVHHLELQVQIDEAISPGFEADFVQAEIDEVDLEFTQASLKNRRRREGRMPLTGCALAYRRGRLPGVVERVVRSSSSIEQFLERSGRKVVDIVVAFGRSARVHEGILA